MAMVINSRRWRRESVNHKYLGWREPLDEGSHVDWDSKYVHVQRGWSACSKAEFERRDQPRLGQAEHPPETNAGNVIQVVYTLKPLTYGDLVSQSQSGTDSFYLFDVAGSATHITDLAGAIANTCVYDSWGNLLSTSAAPFRALFSLSDGSVTILTPIGTGLTLERDPILLR